MARRTHYKTVVVAFCAATFITCCYAIYEDACNQEILDQSYVTYCGTANCESIFDAVKEGEDPNKFDQLDLSNQVVHIVSSRQGKRFKVNRYDALDTNDHFFSESHTNASLFVDTKTKYQRILGFGTTLTDSACINQAHLDQKVRRNLIQDYFNYETGIRLNLISLPIGSTKYSYSNYVLDIPDNKHVELSSYDLNYRIPLIQDIFITSGVNKNRLKLIASASSAPKQFKVNGVIINGGRLREDKIDNYANYLLDYTREYMRRGFNIWSLILSVLPVSSSENSTSSYQFKYNSMTMNPSDVVKLVESINRYKESSSNLKLLLLGDRKEFIPWWTDTLFSTDVVNNSVAGVAYTNSHEKPSPYDNLVYGTRRHPGKYFLVSEPGINYQPKIGNWEYAERYASEIVKNIEYGAVGWIDFSMALNLGGGPVVDAAFKADASIVIRPEVSTYYRNPSFYAIGHLSRYVKPGSIRVKSSMLSGSHAYAIQQVAFITPENELVIFISNNNMEPLAVEIGHDTRTKIQVLLDTKSFNTFLLRLDDDNKFYNI